MFGRITLKGVPEIFFHLVGGLSKGGQADKKFPKCTSHKGKKKILREYKIRTYSSKCSLSL